MQIVAYQRQAVDLKAWDPAVLDVFGVVRESLIRELPGHDIEHIGSTSCISAWVQGTAGAGNLAH